MIINYRQCLSCNKSVRIQKLILGTEKNHDSQRRDRILRFFLLPEIGQFSPHFGAISLLNYTVNLEKRERKVRWRKFKKSSGDGAPKLQICVPCRGQMRPEIPGTFFSNIFNFGADSIWKPARRT